MAESPPVSGTGARTEMYAATTSSPTPSVDRGGPATSTSCRLRRRSAAVDYDGALQSQPGVMAFSSGAWATTRWGYGARCTHGAR